MKKIAEQFSAKWFVLITILMLMSCKGLKEQASAEVTLSDARFNGLTRIVVTTNVPLTGIDTEKVVITRPDGMVIPSSKITDITVSADALSVTIAADQFARITSEGTTIATKAFGGWRACRQRPYHRDQCFAG